MGAHPVTGSRTTETTDRPFARLIGIVVNHTHWDREWYLPFQRFRVLLVDAVDLLLDALATRPSYAGFMLDGQTVVVEDYLEVRPEKRDELARHVGAGRVAIGPWYTLPDEFLPTPESLIRNLLLGRRQTRELGGEPSRVGYLPDSFGHPAQLPQILAGFDLDSAVLFRGVQSDTSEFVWEAPDGTGLLTVYLPGGYYIALELARAPAFWLAERMTESLDRLIRHATTDALLVMTGFDHVQPQPALQELLDEANRRQERVHLRQGTLAEYVDLVRPALPRLPVRSGEWRHNRPSRITPGVLSTRMYLKQADHRAATLLERAAEPLDAWASLLTGGDASGLLTLAWRYLLQNHPHDSICGCSIDAVHRDNETRFRWAEELATDVTDRAARTIARRIDSDARPGRAAGITADTPINAGILLFNTLPVPRVDPVTVRLHFLEPGLDFSLRDADGRPLPFQPVARRPMGVQWEPQGREFHVEGRARPALVVGPREVDGSWERWRGWRGEEVEILVRPDLPPGGWTGIELVPGAAEAVPPPANAVAAGPTWLDNDLVRVEVGADGAFDLLDKSTGRRYGPLNLLRSEADRGDEYSFCPVAGDHPITNRGRSATVRLVEDGPLRSTLEVRLVFAVPAGLAADRSRRLTDLVELPIRSRVSLTAGHRRVEIVTEVDNRARDHRLRALFATGVHATVADAHGQFQVVRRPVELPDEERARVPEFDEEQEVSFHPQRAFVDVSDDRGGFAVLNRGLPEYEAEPGPDGVWLGLTLLRCVGWLSRDDLATRYRHAGPPLETPDAQCLGPHRFAYAVVPHAGDWLAGRVAPEADAYLTPISVAPLPHAPASPGALPPTASFYRLEPPELLFSACKRTDDGRALLLRAYNIAPHPVTATLTLALPGTVRLANLAERPLSDPLPAQPSPDPSASERTFRFPVRPQEIVTILIEPDGNSSALQST